MIAEAYKITPGRNGDWIQTFSGIQFFPLDPRPEDIKIEDIAHALSNQCRFSGHVKNFYSVGQHSVLCSRVCEEPNKLWALIHDASEAFLVDLPRPVKRSPGFIPYLEAEERLMAVICKVCNLDPQMPKEVKEADNRMLITEKEQLMGKPPVAWSDIFKSYDLTIEPWSPARAEEEFLKAFNNLYNKGE